jgi:hypothetical protein
LLWFLIAQVLATTTPTKVVVEYFIADAPEFAQWLTDLAKNKQLEHLFMQSASPEIAQLFKVDSSVTFSFKYRPLILCHIHSCMCGVTHAEASHLGWLRQDP